MKHKEIVKKEIEEEVIVKVSCDNCKKEIECAGVCGYGEKYKLSDAWCYQCEGKDWDFCSLKCLKDFVNNKLAKLEGEE